MIAMAGKTFQARLKGKPELNYIRNIPKNIELAVGRQV